MPTLTTKILMEEMRRRGYGVELLDIPKQPIVVMTTGGRRFYFKGCISNTSSAIGYAVNQNKLHTYVIAQRIGIPIAPYQLYDPADESVAFSFMHEQVEQGFQVLVKPVDLDHGTGITAKISDDLSLRSALNHAKYFSKRIIVQCQFEGDDYRFTVVDGECVAIARRKPPVVKGDGQHTIRELVQQANTQRQEKSEPKIMLRMIRLDDVERYVAADNLDRIVPKGEIVQVTGIANFGRGGTVTDSTDEADASYGQIAVRLASELGLDVCGVDMLCLDVTKPLSSTNTTLLEVNCGIGLRLHHYPNDGKSRNVAGAILDSFERKNGLKPGTSQIASA